MDKAKPVKMQWTDDLPKSIDLALRQGCTHVWALVTDRFDLIAIANDTYPRALYSRPAQALLG